MVETAETYIVCPAVTTEYPLRFLYKVILEVNNLLAVVAVALFTCSNNLVCEFSSLDTTFAVVDPFLEHCLDFLAAAIAFSNSFAHNAFNAVAHLTGCCCHTETKFSIVFEQTVCPSNTLAGTIVLAVWSCRSRTTID